ncbi:MAG: hypothetical protein HQL84_10510 [Magnetococcales bacterium]|nr:hypothetical protein [Magnetococcales bacterium]MBF0150463.1 hypothetical protein [Magnetococcales bacterium]MBF0174696.1 hypothetical protein [Magnetococcales bacterium]MBF0348145.1 hypothetical protein [Magnetococcales bacterium]MBF0629471.1 hypothetical protein [Magnetococcales bacterium]
MLHHAVREKPSSFHDRMTGPFDGLVKIDDARKLAVEIEAMGPWYLNEPLTGAPSELVDGGRARGHLEQLLDEILREEKGVWTTMVYVQSRDNPELIKVFHPRRAGCGCGGGGRIVPWWILSRGVVPESIQSWVRTTCAVDAVETKGWLRKYFP